MSYSAEEKRLLQNYLDDHPTDEVDPQFGSSQVHHIFGKWCEELRKNPLNFVALVGSNHAIAEFMSVQDFAEKIFKVQISKYGQAFINFANQYGGKTWRVFCEKSLTNT